MRNAVLFAVAAYVLVFIGIYISSSPFLPYEAAVLVGIVAAAVVVFGLVLAVRKR